MRFLRKFNFYFNRCLNRDVRVPIKKAALARAKHISESKFFNAEYYSKHEEVPSGTNIELAHHYLEKGWLQGYEPSEEFSGEGYFILNPDVKLANVNPLLHYEMAGKSEGRSYRYFYAPISFPDDAISHSSTNKKNTTVHKRVAIFASFNSKGLIPDSVIYYLQGLREVVDNIVFIGDNPIFETELDKIKDLVCFADCQRHEEYDFGSYKRGFFYAKESGLLDDVEELIICNDSCYGPIFPFSESFDSMEQVHCDFWGMTINSIPKKHIQSFFYVFKSQVFNSTAFEEFMRSIKKERSVHDVIMNYEVELTELLERAGFKYTSFIPEEYKEIRENLTIYPKVLIEETRCPLVKVKCFSEENFLKDDISRNGLLGLIASNNEPLASVIDRNSHLEINPSK